MFSNGMVGIHHRAFRVSNNVIGMFRVVNGMFRVVNGWDSARTRPPGVPEASINWVCHPTNLGVKWDCEQLAFD